ncbi:MAG: hypothetical protein M1819_002235 [Sarea resinae]|nr:MAG: hypothetical protein M1819_002235 [Sarea resinae]
MALGILDDRKLPHVPGTVRLDGDRQDESHCSTPLDEQLKYDTSGPVPVILVPQPSNDPNDPLNWPLWRRDVILLILSTVSVIASTLSPLLAANTITLSLYLRRTFTDTALLTGYHLCGVGVAGLLFTASARVWGKRHLYLLGTVLLIVSGAWGGASGHSYKSLLWARIIQGVALAPFEGLVNASVGDLYFVHERGKRMALSNLCLFGGAFFTPVIVGKMTHSIGWQWTFYFIAIFSAALLPFVIFFVPETAYRRAAHLNTDFFANGKSLKDHENQTTSVRHDINGDELLCISHDTDGSGSAEKQPGDAEVGSVDQTAPPLKVSFAKSLLPFNGRKTDESFFKLLLRPLPLFFHPAIFWGCLIQGTLIGWTVLIGVVLAAIFLGPPLFFTEVKTGYMYTGAFIGAVLGFLLAGLLADYSARLMTRRNKGVYEPEFRIVLVIPQLALGAAGLYGFGIVGADVEKYGWFWPEFFFALEVMGMVLGAVASALYIVDAHRDISVEAFTCMLVFKNMFSFGLTWGAYDWLRDIGIRKLFYIVASIQVGVCLLSIPMYILGKRNRSFFYRHDILKGTHLS